MRTRSALSALLFLTGLFTVAVERSEAQAKAPGRGGAPAPQVESTLGQLMKGILFPNSNVIFAAQSQDPAKVPEAKDPATATDPLANTYGKWQAVENSALALAEAANLLTIPGRKCSNGLPVPLGNADWPKLVQGLRDAGRKAYKQPSRRIWTKFWMPPTQ